MLNELLINLRNLKNLNRMRRITQILIVIVIVVLLLPLLLPKSINTTVAKEFDLPVGMIFEEFNNLNEYSKWEPWVSSDSLVKQEFFAPYRGLNAGYQWKSATSNGEITIKKLETNKSLEYDLVGLDLGEKTTMKVDFTPINNTSTKVTWGIASDEIGYFSRYYTYFTSQKLQETLANGFTKLEERLKTMTISAEQAKSLQPGMIKTEMFEGLKLIALYNETSLEFDEIKTATEESLGMLYSYLIDLKKVDTTHIGNPVSYIEYVDLVAEKSKFYCGYPIRESIEIQEGMEIKSLPAKESLVSIHKGSYETIDSTLTRMKEYAKTNNLSIGMSYLEEYQNDPETVKNPDDLLTKVYIPIN